MSVSVSVHGGWMAGEVFIWFVGLQRTGHFVTGPSEKSACVLRGRRVCTINYFYTPVSRLSTRASGSARRATRARAGRGRRPAPPPPLCCLQRAARPAAPLYFIDVSLSALSVTLGRSRRSRVRLGDALSRLLEHAACRREPEREHTSRVRQRVYSLFNQLSTRVPSFNLEPWKHHVTNT